MRNHFLFYCLTFFFIAFQGCNKEEISESSERLLTPESPTHALLTSFDCSTDTSGLAIFISNAQLILNNEDVEHPFWDHLYEFAGEPKWEWSTL